MAVGGDTGFTAPLGYSTLLCTTRRAPPAAGRSRRRGECPKETGPPAWPTRAAMLSPSSQDGGQSDCAHKSCDVVTEFQSPSAGSKGNLSLSTAQQKIGGDPPWKGLTKTGTHNEEMAVSPRAVCLAWRCEPPHVNETLSEQKESAKTAQYATHRYSRSFPHDAVKAKLTCVHCVDSLHSRTCGERPKRSLCAMVGKCRRSCAGSADVTQWLDFSQ